MFVNSKTPYCHDISSFQLDYRFSAIVVQITVSYFYECQQTDSEVSVERQKTPE